MWRKIVHWIPWKIQAQNILCTNIVLNAKTKTKKNNFCTQHVLYLYFLGNSINNLSSYCGLTDARMWASEKGLCTCNACFYKMFIINLSLEPVSKVLSLFLVVACCLLVTTYQTPTILRMTAIFLFCLQQIDQNKTKPQGDSLWLLLSHVCSGVRANLKSYQNFLCISAISLHRWFITYYFLPFQKLKSFTMSKMVRQLLCQKVCQKISVIITKTWHLCFYCLQDKTSIKKAKISVCFDYWDFLTNFLT